MANKTIAQLVLKTPLLVTDEIEVQATAGGASNKGTLQDVIDLVPGGGGSSGTLGLVQLSDGVGGFADNDLAWDGNVLLMGGATPGFQPFLQGSDDGSILIQSTNGTDSTVGYLQMNNDGSMQIYAGATTDFNADGSVSFNGNVDAPTFSISSVPGIDGTITTADGAYTFTKGLLTAFTPA